MYSIALAMGISCSAGCGSVSTPFLSAFILGKGKNIKSSFLSTLIFSLGKIIVMAILGGSSAYLGSEAISSGMNILGFDITNIFNIITFFIGLFLVITSINKHKCSTCNSKDTHNGIIVEKDEAITRNEYIMLFTAGIAYGITPCVPLITMLASAASLSIFNGVLLLSFFGFVTCITPSIMQNLFAGFVAPKVKENLKANFKFISALAGSILMFSSIISIV